MTQITSRDFRSNQAAFFAMADKGEQIIIRRRGKQSYMLIPVSDDDFVLTSELKTRIANARKEHSKGSLRSFNDKDKMNSWLESL